MLWLKDATLQAQLQSVIQADQAEVLVASPGQHGSQLASIQNDPRTSVVDVAHPDTVARQQRELESLRSQLASRIALSEEAETLHNQRLESMQKELANTVSLLNEAKVAKGQVAGELASRIVMHEEAETRHKGSMESMKQELAYTASMLQAAEAANQKVSGELASRLALHEEAEMLHKQRLESMEKELETMTALLSEAEAAKQQLTGELVTRNASRESETLHRQRLESAERELASTGELLNEVLAEADAEKAKLTGELASRIASHEATKARHACILESVQGELASMTTLFNETNAAKDSISAELTSLRDATYMANTLLALSRQHYHQVLLSQLPLIPPQATVISRDLARDEPKYKALTEMFHGSMVKHRASSRSGYWCCAPRVSVTRICELFHADKQQEYEQARRARCSRGDCGDCTRIDGMTAMKCEVPPYWKDMNEYLLYHGTSFRKAEGILRTGFDPQRGGDMTGSMFGKGTYFAQNASKSDFYTTCNECTSDNCKECRHAQGERCILVARVLLGESFVETAPTVDTKHWIKAPDQCDGNPYDSVTGACRAHGGVVDHMEFVVFKESRMHVQFQIFYAHDASCNCSNCIYRHRQ
ncbi:Tnks [Symbiodinium sp. CCMP2456]|nr:Tnks [Symbiodinium sp. CCMP2456]